MKEKTSQPNDHWIPAAQEFFLHLPADVPMLERWKDFLLWTAYQAAEPRKHDPQAEITARYGRYSKVLFSQIFRILCLAVAENPHQNALLKLCQALHLTGAYTYDESAAERLLSVQLANHAEAIGSISLKDSNCASTRGSALIALANVVKRSYPKNYQEKAIFIAAGSSDGYSHLISYIQLSIMGMPAYVLQDDVQIDDYSELGLFIPENAICTPEFFSDAWMKARWKAVVKAATK